MCRVFHSLVSEVPMKIFWVTILFWLCIIIVYDVMKSVLKLSRGFLVMLTLMVLYPCTTCLHLMLNWQRGIPSCLLLNANYFIPSTAFVYATSQFSETIRLFPTIHWLKKLVNICNQWFCIKCHVLTCRNQPEAHESLKLCWIRSTQYISKNCV